MTLKFTIIAFGPKSSEGIAVIERDAQVVADWAERNGLELNLKKSSVMLIGS